MRICKNVLYALFIIALLTPIASQSHFSVLHSTSPQPVRTNSSQQFPSTESAGDPGRAFLVGTVNVAGLPSASSKTVATSSPAIDRFVQGHPRTNLQSTVANFSSSAAGILTSFQGLNQTQGGGYAPPDVAEAPGPSHIVEMVNLAGEIFNKQGVTIQTFPLSSFFLTGTDRLSDPKVLYDSQSGRWFTSIIDLGLLVVNGTDESRFNITLAVSASSDPTGSWRIYNIRLGEILPDQPIIGISDDKFVVSANDYLGTIGPFMGAQYWVLNKNEMVNGVSTVDFVSFGPISNLESVHPVQSFSSTTTQYLVSVGAGDIATSTSSVQLISITGVPSAPVTVSQVALPVSLISVPPSAVEPDATHPIRTDDFRVLRAVWYQGLLWYSLTDACTPPGDTTVRSCARLTEIDTGALSIVQDFDLAAPGQYFFYPAVSMDFNENLAVVYGYSSSTIFPSLAVTGQLVNDLPGTVVPPLTLVQGTNNDESINDRYGDYFSASMDPSSATQVWVGGEYDPTPSGWSTFLGSMTMFTSLTVTANPTYLNIPANSTATSAITLRSIAGFSGTVSISTAVSRNGPSASVTPSNVTLARGSTASATLHVNSTSTSNGSYTVVVTATGNGMSAQVQVHVTVGPDFSMAASSTTLSVQAGTTRTFNTTLNSLTGFAGTIALTSSVSPKGPSVTLNPTSVTLTSGGSVNLTVSVASGATGLFTITVTGTSAPLRQTVTVILIVNGFSLSDNPATMSVPAGSSGSSTILVSSVNGFGGIIRLSAIVSPSGPTATLSPTSLTLSAGGIITAKLSLNVPSSAAGGVYLVTLIGANASESASASISLIVTPFSVSINNNTTFTGVTVTTTGTLSIDSPSILPTLSGTVSVTAKNATTGKTLFTKSYAIASNPVSKTFLLNVGVSPYPLASVNSVSLSGSTATDSVGVYRNPDLDANGIVDISDVNTVAASYGCSQGQSCYNPRADLDADGVDDFIDVSIVSADFGDTNSIPNFTLSVGSTSLLLPAGTSASTSISLSSNNGFAGTVSLATYLSLGTVNATLSASSVTLKSGGSGSSTLTVKSSIYGIFKVNVTATSGVLSHSSIITVYVADFDMFADNSQLTILTNGTSNGSASTAIEMFGFNGFTGTATVSTSVTPSKGLNATASPPIVNFPAFGPHVDTFLTVSSHTVGGYTVTVKVTLGSLSHSLSVDVIVCQIGKVCNQLKPQGQTPATNSESNIALADKLSPTYPSQQDLKRDVAPVLSRTTGFE
jgi:hypothetical protein